MWNIKWPSDNLAKTSHLTQQMVSYHLVALTPFSCFRSHSYNISAGATGIPELLQGLLVDEDGGAWDL